MISAGQTIDHLPLERPLLIGFGITGRAVATALVDRGFKPIVVDDRPSDSAAALAADLGVELITAPDDKALADAVSGASALLPSPGVPDAHPAFALAAESGVPVLSEFDLARHWDRRPMVAITGTNGKTTVTMMVTEALRLSGVRAEAVGNTEVPLIAAIDDDTTEVFVVEASSFRLAHSRRFSPAVAGWLNFAPDHLDAHRSLEDYEQAKASMWAHLPDGALVVANADDPVVVAHLDDVDHTRVRVERFSLTDPVEWRLEPAGGPVAEATLVGPAGPVVAVADLPRRQPHDVANALGAAALATGGGATADGVETMLRGFIGLPHRLQYLGTADGVAWYNDSKATVPHATVVAVSGFDSVVLIAGGRNKGLSLDMLASTVPPVRAVVATGDAAADIEAVFAGAVPVERVPSMERAVDAARGLAQAGDVVVLSPACTSFDWYPNYSERGRHFTELVENTILAARSGQTATRSGQPEAGRTQATQPQDTQPKAAG